MLTVHRTLESTLKLEQVPSNNEPSENIWLCAVAAAAALNTVPQQRAASASHDDRYNVDPPRTGMMLTGRASHRWDVEAAICTEWAETDPAALKTVTPPRQPTPPAVQADH